MDPTAANRALQQEINYVIQTVQQHVNRTSMETSVLGTVSQLAIKSATNQDIKYVLKISTVVTVPCTVLAQKICTVIKAVLYNVNPITVVKNVVWAVWHKTIKYAL